MQAAAGPLPRGLVLPRLLAYRGEATEARHRLQRGVTDEPEPPPDGLESLYPGEGAQGLAVLLDHEGARDPAQVLKAGQIAQPTIEGDGQGGRLERRDAPQRGQVPDGGEGGPAAPVGVAEPRAGLRGEPTPHGQGYGQLQHAPAVLKPCEGDEGA